MRLWPLTIDCIQLYLTVKAAPLRRSALRALTLLDQPIAQEAALGIYLDDALDEQLRETAVNTIGHFELRELVPQLRVLGAGDGPVDVRMAAIAVLGTWGDQESRALFESALKDPSRRVRRAATRALNNLEKAPADTP